MNGIRNAFEQRADKVRENRPGAFRTSPLLDTPPSIPDDRFPREVPNPDDWEPLGRADDDQYIPPNGDDRNDAYRASRELDDEVEDSIADMPPDLSETVGGVGGRVKSHGIDALAWYHPIHAADANGKWGITIDDIGFRANVSVLCQKSGMPKGQAALLLANEVNTHEMFHHRVEAYGIKIESRGEGITRGKYDGVYLNYGENINSPLIDAGKSLEEALATAEAFCKIDRNYQSLFDHTAPSYRNYVYFLTKNERIAGRDRLAGMIAECTEHPIPRPVDFPGDGDEARSMVPCRVVRGIDGRSLYDAAISFLRPAFGDFTQILKGYGVNVVNTGRGRHPFKYQIPGQPLHPLTVGPDGRIADRLIAEMEDALNVPRGQIRRELQLSGKALRAQRRRTMINGLATS